MPEGVTLGETSAVEGFVGRAHLAVPSGAVFEDGLGGRGVPSVRHQGRAYGVVVFALEVADIVALMEDTHLLGEGGKGLYLSIVLGQGQAYLSHRVVGLEAREDEGITLEGITDDLGGRVAEVTEGRAQTFSKISKCTSDWEREEPLSMVIVWLRMMPRSGMTCLRGMSVEEAKRIPSLSLMTSPISMRLCPQKMASRARSKKS